MQLLFPEGVKRDASRCSEDGYGVNLDSGETHYLCGGDQSTRYDRDRESRVAVIESALYGVQKRHNLAITKIDPIADSKSLCGAVATAGPCRGDVVEDMGVAR